MKLAIIIPAFNEESTIKKVINSIPKDIKGISKKEILVINDGSIDKTAKIAAKSGATVISHLINQGVGAATITGIDAAKLISADIAVTLDGDGQHDAKEIENIVNKIIIKKYDVVIGSRKFARADMPLIKVIGNTLMSRITYAMYGLLINDSQSGFKGFSKKAINKMVLTSHGYEICSEIVSEIKRLKLKYTEVPIKTIYTPYSKKRGQFALNGVNIIIKLITKAIIK